MVWSNFDEQVEDQNKDKQVGKEENDSAFVLVVGSLDKVDERLRPLSAVVVLSDCETHDDAYNQTSQVPDVVHVGLSQTYLDVEQQNYQDKDDQSESLHRVRLS